jgi:hypothetical protein
MREYVMSSWILGTFLFLQTFMLSLAAQSTPAATDDHALSGPQLLLQQLATSPVVEEQGVVDARGVNGSMSRGDAEWILLFQLDGWRVGDGVLRTDKLVVRQLVEREAIDRMRARVKPYQLIRIRARLSEQNVFNRPEALLLEVVDDGINDPQLAAHARALQKPVTMEDPVLGILTLDRRLDFYSGNARWRGADIEVMLIAYNDAERAAALATAHALFAAQDDWQARVTAFAVEKLLALKNDVWLGEDETRFSARQFRKQLRLYSINVYPEGRFEFWFEDGDLFWGHDIEIDGSLKDGPRDANLAG